jgi:hypothetical protein
VGHGSSAIGCLKLIKGNQKAGNQTELQSPLGGCQARAAVRGLLSAMPESTGEKQDYTRFKGVEFAK